MSVNCCHLYVIFDTAKKCFGRFWWQVQIPFSYVRIEIKYILYLYQRWSFCLQFIYKNNWKACCRGWLTVNRCIMKDEKRKKWCGHYRLTWLNGRYLTFMCQNVIANVRNIIGNNSNILPLENHKIFTNCALYNKRVL